MHEIRKFKATYFKEKRIRLNLRMKEHTTTTNNTLWMVQSFVGELLKK